MLWKNSKQFSFSEQQYSLTTRCSPTLISQTKTTDLSEQLSSNMSRPVFKRNWDPVQDWPKSSLIDQCTGEPFFPEPIDTTWLDTARKTLETSPWPGFLCFPLVTSVCPEISPSVEAIQQRQMSQADCDKKTWKISLDVCHFCAEEISIKSNKGYLEISGKHEERQDDHGVTSRSFTRKYKLPAEVDWHQMSSSLSPEGFLLVEVPLGSSSTTFPAETIIPIQMKQKQ